MINYALNILLSKLRELQVEKQMWIDLQYRQYIDNGIFERIDYEIASLKDAIFILKNCESATNIIIASKINSD